MSNKNKPTPPPLDGNHNDPSEQHGTSGVHGSHGTADTDIPAATSGKADAAAADVQARDAALREAQAGHLPPPPPQPQMPPQPTGEPRALINNSGSVFVARPDPTRPISTTAAVVQGNWCGTFEGKTANVKHGTPIADLPKDLQKLIVETRGQVVGPLPPRQPQNPFTP